mmetsp:Transcript_11821/g.19695  ORF Transcript_11821/g.19695 Transcript_11821/m.19695 type:complete len:258 (-) Transcript_11821:107-880(-)
MKFQVIASLLALLQVLGNMYVLALVTAEEVARLPNKTNIRRRRNLAGGAGGGERREWSYRNTQIRGYRYSDNGQDYDEVCWALDGGSTRDGTSVVLQRCDKKDDAQKFHIEVYSTGKNGRPTWDEAYNAATVVNDCDYCDFGGLKIIRPKLDPGMAVSVPRAAEKAPLRIKRAKESQLSYEASIFFDLEGGELILGDGMCSYFEDCLIAVNQGLNADIGDPIMLRSGKTLFKQNEDYDVTYGIPRDDIIASWDPFGS